MSIKSPERKLTPTLDTPLADSESVSQYLSAHPGFFDQHPELLDKMSVPHTERGSAISLVERQVQNLRSNNKELNKQLQELLDVARENDRLADRLHRFTLTLIDCSSLEEIISAIEVGLMEEFGIDQVVTGLNLETSTKNHSIDPDLLEKIFPVGTAATPVCFSDPGQGYFQELFDSQSSTIGSSVVLPLGGHPVTGLLALGSIDEQRFQPGMSTVYLTRLTDLINGVLDPYTRENSET